jgi:protein TonB
MDATDDTVGLTERLVPPLDTGQRAFRIALAVAFLIHAAFLIQIGRAVPRAVGNPAGQTDAIAVDLVSAADLKSREAFALPPPGASPVAPSPPPQPQTPPPEPAVEPAPPEPTPPVAEPKPAPPEPAPPSEVPKPDAPKPEAEVKPPETPKPDSKSAEPAKSTLQDFESALPDLATVPMPSEKDEAAEPPKPEPDAPDATQEPTENTKPKEEKRPEPAKKKTAALDMRSPSPKELANAPAGRSAAATRPPGITRSGENDEFGRAVVLALRGTMPPPRGVLGSVVVRLILTENGDLANVTVLQPSGRGSLDESVVFATKQTYFPLPPYKSTLADRTFTIRYVYR